MLGLAIPAYRLPNDVVDKDVANVTAVGVEIQTDARVDDVAALKDEGFDAVLLAIGTHRPPSLRVPGEQLRRRPERPRVPARGQARRRTRRGRQARGGHRGRQRSHRRGAHGPPPERRFRRLVSLECMRRCRPTLRGRRGAGGRRHLQELMRDRVTSKARTRVQGVELRSALRVGLSTSRGGSSPSTPRAPSRASPATW